MGQTPPPWHGQAVATQILFEHDWPDFQVHRLRMEYSGEMDEVGRFQIRKLWHLLGLIRKARRILKSHPGCILFYPPASANWVPFLRDMIFLHAVRHLAGRTVFIFHASSLPVFADRYWLTRALSHRAYDGADVSLEVAKEAAPPHRLFRAWAASWCPCAIEVGNETRSRKQGGPFVSLFVASLQEGKGVLEVLKTAKILKDKGREGDFHFRIVGKWFSADFEKEAHELHSELGLRSMVEFVGQLTGDKKWQAYADADAFFFPTHYASEATPIVIMEALGMGLPVLSTHWAGIPDMLDGCETATLLPIHNPQAYADALVKMASNPDTRDTHRNNAIEFYRQHYQPERFIERVANALYLAAKQNEEHVDARGEQREATRDMRANKAAPDHALSTNPKHSSLRPAGSHLHAPCSIRIYLADQNPKLGRSLGISRMTELVVEELGRRGDFLVQALASKSSILPEDGAARRVLPWKTKSVVSRVITDNLHPLAQLMDQPQVWYYPKGFLPILHSICKPSLVTIHDTIIQHYADNYPRWRHRVEYKYWAHILTHTLTNADHIMTVSETSKRHIKDFMWRNGIQEREITVTYEPCLYERIPQPAAPRKEDYILHLASREPHKRTAWLVKYWMEPENAHLPTLHLVGYLPAEIEYLVANTNRVRKLPFLNDSELQQQFMAARALVFPSEIEGFGLPAVEAYYLGTPVCFVRNTSVEEVLAVATRDGGFDLHDIGSLSHAIREVVAMKPDEVRRIGLKLREVYAATKAVDRMCEVFTRALEASRDHYQ